MAQLQPFERGEAAEAGRQSLQLVVRAVELDEVTQHAERGRQRLQLVVLRAELHERWEVCVAEVLGQRPQLIVREGEVDEPRELRPALRRRQSGEPVVCEIEFAQLVQLIREIVRQARDLILRHIDCLERLARLPPVCALGKRDGRYVPNLVGERRQLPALQLQITTLSGFLQQLCEVARGSRHDRRIVLLLLMLALSAAGQGAAA